MAPSCCNSKSCVKVISPSEPIAMASVSEAEPILPASGIIRLPLRVVTCDALNVAAVLPPVAIVITSEPENVIELSVSPSPAILSN